MIHLANVTLNLASEAGEVEILKGIDMSLPQGATASVVGPSGSGKSSLLAIIGGIERATSGTVTINGTEFTALSEDALARYRRDHIGILFQSFHLLPTMTALENVAMPLELAGKPNAFKRAEDELKRVGLAHRIGHYPGQLSGGEQQRVAMARALIHEPELLLADEPTGNLDGRTGADIIGLMFEQAEARGMSLLLITHDDDLAARCAHRFRMEDGRMRPFEAASLTSAEAAE